MNQILFGTDNISVVLNNDQNYNLSVVYTDPGWSLMCESYVWAGFPLAGYTDNQGNYSLAIIVTSSTMTPQSFTYKGNRYALSIDSSSRTMLTIESSGSNTSVAGYTVWNGLPLSFNSAKQIFVTAVTIVQEDEVSQIFVNGMPLKIVRSGNKWYLCVNDLNFIPPNSISFTNFSSDEFEVLSNGDFIFLSI